jgi:hypothetical protein
MTYAMVHLSFIPHCCHVFSVLHRMYLYIEYRLEICSLAHKIACVQ